VIIVAGLAQFAGYVAFSIYFGRMIFSFFRTEMNIYLEYVTGMLVLLLVNAAVFLMAPYTGVPGALILYLLYSLFIHSVGLGIVALTRFGAEKKRTAQETDFQRTRYRPEAPDFNDLFHDDAAGNHKDRKDPGGTEDQWGLKKGELWDGKEEDEGDERE
jgi:hypothetical protein